MPRTISEEPPFPWTVEVMDAVVESTRAEIEDKVVARRLGLRTSMTETTDGIQSAVRETKEQRENRENTTALFMRLHPSMLGVVASAAFPHVLAALAVTARFGKGGHELKNVHLKPGTQELMLGILTKAAESGARGVVERMDFAQQLWGLDLCEGALAPNGRDHHELDRRLGDYFKAFGGNRFGFTIAFAVAEEDWEETGDISKTIRTLDEVREEASGIEEPSRQDAIIRAVLSIHKSRGIRENLNEKLLNVPGRSGRAWKDAFKQALHRVPLRRVAFDSGDDWISGRRGMYLRFTSDCLSWEQSGRRPFERTAMDASMPGSRRTGEAMLSFSVCSLGR